MISDHMLEMLTLKEIGEDRFEGLSIDFGLPQVFGGQVIAQALLAAKATLPQDRNIHSLHAYFLRRGDPSFPVDYEVIRLRDGHSFSARSVTASQNKETIFVMTISAQDYEEGPQYTMPPIEVPPPETFPEVKMHPYKKDLFPKARYRYPIDEVIEYRPFFMPAPKFVGQFQKYVWVRIKPSVQIDSVIQQQALLGFLSDYGLLSTGVLPLKESSTDRSMARDERIKIASIDHAMWLFQTCKPGDWVLYFTNCSRIANGRAETQGWMYDTQGHLLASTAQEGLVRMKKN